jgi:hypothetical protein
MLLHPLLLPLLLPLTAGFSSGRRLLHSVSSRWSRSPWLNWAPRTCREEGQQQGSNGCVMCEDRSQGPTLLQAPNHHVPQHLHQRCTSCTFIVPRLQLHSSEGLPCSGPCLPRHVPACCHQSPQGKLLASLMAPLTMHTPAP